MAYNTSFDASNKADFVAQISATDIETGDDIDFTGAAVSIKIAQENCSPIISLSIGSGITQPTGLILEMTVTDDQMAALRPGSYRIGGVYSLNGSTTQLFVGDFVVYDGIAAV